jgi:hypothetical protein
MLRVIIVHMMGLPRCLNSSKLVSTKVSSRRRCPACTRLLPRSRIEVNTVACLRHGGSIGAMQLRHGGDMGLTVGVYNEDIQQGRTMEGGGRGTLIPAYAPCQPAAAPPVLFDTTP